MPLPHHRTGPQSATYLHCPPTPPSLSRPAHPPFLPEHTGPPSSPQTRSQLSCADALKAARANYAEGLLAIAMQVRHPRPSPATNALYRSPISYSHTLRVHTDTHAHMHTHARTHTHTHTHLAWLHAHPMPPYAPPLGWGRGGCSDGKHRGEPQP